MQRGGLFLDLRRNLLYLCLVGIDSAWFALLLPLLGVQSTLSWSPLILWGMLAVGMCGCLVVLELFNRIGLGRPWYPLAVAALVLLTIVGLMRVVIYNGWPFWSWGWGEQILLSFLLFETWPRPELALAATGFFVWQRATWATRRSLDWRDVSSNFWLGLFFLGCGGLFWELWLKQPAPLAFVWGYFGLGMVALALTRAHTAPLLVRSMGAELSPVRLAQLGMTVGLTLLIGGLSWWGLSQPLIGFVAWLGPLWNFLFVLVEVLVVLLIFVGWRFWQFISELLKGELLPALQNLEDISRSIQQLGEQLAQQAGLNFVWPPWLGLVLRIGVALLILLPGLWLVLVYLGIIQPPRRREDDEYANRLSAERLLWDGLDSLRDLGRLMRRYGFSRQMLAAISVQNLYANVCRLGRRQGRPRRPSQPPDAYLPQLVAAFEGLDSQLSRITEAYMQVHYGDRSVTNEELARLRKDYAEVRAQAGRKRRLDVKRKT